MRWWDELVGFVRGTRPPPPRGPKRPVVTAFLVVAAVLHLPLVYLLVRDVALSPPFTLAVGLLSMGLAWGAGVSLEGRRAGTVRAITALGVAEGALAFVPVLAEALGPARFLFVAIAAACALAAVALLRAQPSS